MQTEESQTPESRKGVHLWLLLWKATKAVEAPAHRSVKAKDLGLTDVCVLEALLHKGQRVQFAVLRETLDGANFGALSLDRERQARELRTPVDEHRAQAALALLTAMLGAGEVRILAQHLEQRVRGRYR